MRYVAAYLLAALNGKEPSSSDVEKILSSVGIEIDAEKLKKVVSELKGKDLEEVIAKGQEKLASMPAGGGAAPVAAAAAAPAAGGASPAKDDKKKEAKKEESEESDDDMGFGLFD